MLGLQNAFTFDPWLLFEGTSTEGTAAFSSSAAPREILPLDVLRLTVAPAKGWLLFKFFGRSSFSYPESYRCLYYPRLLEVK